MALLRIATFWPPSMVYILVTITKMLQITLLHCVDLLWAVIKVSTRNHGINVQYLYDTYYHWKILALAGIWTSDFPSTKPMRNQFSYPGLNKKLFYKVASTMLKLNFFESFFIKWQCKKFEGNKQKELTFFHQKLKKKLWSITLLGLPFNVFPMHW